MFAQWWWTSPGKAGTRTLYQTWHWHAAVQCDNVTIICRYHKCIMYCNVINGILDLKCRYIHQLCHAMSCNAAMYDCTTTATTTAK